MTIRLPDFSNKIPNPSTPPRNVGLTNLDTLMQQIGRKLNVDPIGTHYNPGQFIEGNPNPVGGYTPSVKRYYIPEKIFIPYKDDTGAVVGRDRILTGDVTEADLIAAGCHIQFLLESGHIIENGFARV